MTISDEAKEQIESIKEHGKEFQGRKQLIAHLEGKKQSRKAAMLALCYRCSGFYSDGGVDCDDPCCPLYDYMPFNTKIKEEKKNRKKNRPKQDIPAGFRKKVQE